MTPEQLQRLRRFSLAIGVILFSYVAADFEPISREAGRDPTITTPIMGFEIHRPDLIPIGLVLASIWGLARFWYYGPMTELSPWRHRRKIFSDAKKVNDEGSYSVEFKNDSESVEFARLLKKYFPRFANREMLSEISDVTRTFPPEMFTEGSRKFSSETTKTGTRVTFNISQRQRAAAWFQDLDFYSPVIVNVIALGIFLYQFLTTPEVVHAASKIPPS